MKVRNVTLLIWLICTNVAIGQHLNYTRFFLDKGLSQSQVTCMEIDKYGYLWLGTDGGGVDYFDGKQFTNIKTEQGLSYTRVVSLIVRDNNEVICGIKQHFFSIIKRDTILNFDSDTLYGNTTVTAFTQKENGEIWFGNDEGDIFRLEGDTTVIHELSLGYSIKSLSFVSEDSLFISTTKGLYLRKDTTVSNIPLFKGIEVNQIKVNTDGIIWAATNRGVAYFENDTWFWDKKFNSRVNSSITQILTFSPDEIWFSTYGSGVVKWDREKHFFLNSANGLPNLFCTAIIHDFSNNIWIGTDGGGLVKFSGEQFLHYLKTDNPLFEAVMTISQDKSGNKWIGTFGNGIVIIDKKQKVSKFAGNSQMPSNVIYSIEHLKDGRILVGSKDSDVIVIEKDKKTVKTYHTPENKKIVGAIVIKEDTKGRIWFGTAKDGVYVISNQKVMNIQKDIPGINIKTISITNRDTIWIGTEDGGAFSLEYNQIDEYFESTNPSDLKINYNQLPFTKKNLVCGIDYDMYGNLWVGTFAYGLFCIKPDGTTLQYTTATGLLSNNIYSVLTAENGSVWFGTDRGVHQVLFRQPSAEPYIVAYGVEQGFEGLECNLNALFDDSDGCIWIGNIYGVSVFNSEAKHTHSAEVKLHFTCITTTNTVSNYYYPVLNKPAEGIILSHDNNNLIFSFKAIDMKLPSNVIYSYFMENLDAEWIKPSSTNIATYSFIPPGKYIFRAKATNGEGEWSENEISIPVVVKPPFYQTAWFIALLILIILLGMALFLWYRQLALIRRNRMLKELVESRTIELQLETMRVQQQGEELRVQAENLSLMNAELKKLSVVASKTDNAVLIANKNLEWEWANEGFTKMYGYTLDEYIDAHGKKILDSKSNKKIEHVIEEILTNKRSVTYSNRTSNKMGEELWVQSTLTPVYDDKGNLQMIAVIEINITHIKHINNELRKLSLVASKTDNAVIIMNKHGEIEWVNEGFHRMYEISLDEFKNLYGTTIFEFHNDADSLQRIKDLYETDQTQSFVSKHVTPEGKEKWIQTVLTPIIFHEHKYEQLIAVETDITRIKEAEEEIIIQKENTDKLLKNILPEEIAEELKSKGFATPRYYKSVTVLFADVKDFSKYCQSLTPQQLLHELHEYFNEFDEIIKQNYVEKIKTVGDAYMCVGGVPVSNSSHAFNTLLVGLQIQKKAHEINQRKVNEGRLAWEFRVGLHTGEIISGVIGKQKFAYDVWGDTVNIASRMESSCDPGRVNISGSTYKMIKDYFECEYRGKQEIKNRGMFDMYFVNRIKTEYSQNGDGITPNESFKQFLAEL